MDPVKIIITELKPGMFIVNPGISWLRAPLLYMQEGLITSQEEIDTIVRQGFAEAYHDPSRFRQMDSFAKDPDADHPGGLAIVGDGGKKEGIVTNNGLFITPDKPTLVDLPAHAQVIPDLSYIYDRRGLTSDYGLLEQKLKNMREEGIVVNVNNDYSRLERKMESNTKQLQNIGRIMKKANHIADYNWISSRV